MWRKLCWGSGHGTCPLGAPHHFGNPGNHRASLSLHQTTVLRHHLQSACNS